MSDIPPNTPGTTELPSGEDNAPANPPAPADGGQGSSQRAWAPSPRVTAVLAAAMLAVGVAVGAAIGPAPTASFAGASAEIPLLLHSIIASSRPAAPEAGAAAETPASAEPEVAGRHRRKRRHAAGETASASESANATSSEEGSGSSTSNSTGSTKTKTSALPAITKVWVVELNGGGFEEALAAPTSASYIDSQAIPSGSFLHTWSGLSATAFATDAALISTTEPQSVQSIRQPPCPEGAAGTACAAGTPGAISTADSFLQHTLPTITSSAAYRTSGLIVVTFGTIAAGESSELPAGSTTATLTSQPPAGALLISPFVAKGARPTTTFNPSSPRQSLEALLHR